MYTRYGNKYPRSHKDCIPITRGKEKSIKIEKKYNILTNCTKLVSHNSVTQLKDKWENLKSHESMATFEKQKTRESRENHQSFCGENRPQCNRDMVKSFLNHRTKKNLHRKLFSPSYCKTQRQWSLIIGYLSEGLVNVQQWWHSVYKKGPVPIHVLGKQLYSILVWVGSASPSAFVPCRRPLWRKAHL